jgi:proteasome beta subunit
MELPPRAALDHAFAGSGDDFAELLRRRGLIPPGAQGGAMAAGAAAIPQTQATTILAFKFEDGVLVAGDRRATRETLSCMIGRTRCWRSIGIQSWRLPACPATAWEMARVLEHSFQFFRRTQLQEMSVDGKVRALSKLLRDNFGFVMQGVASWCRSSLRTTARTNLARGFTSTMRWARTSR